MTLFPITCPECDGDGNYLAPVATTVKPVECDRCHGSGEIELDEVEYAQWKRENQR